MRGINSVLNEQELQDMDGKWNPEALAYIYGMASEESLRVARERALGDQLDVLMEHQSVSDQVMTPSTRTVP
jgi:hypothetical protein